MKRFALAMIVLFCITAPAMAQQAENDVLSVPGVNPEELQADEDKRTEYANMYYKRCMKNRLSNMTEATQDLTCMCHTVHMVKALKLPELEILATGKGSIGVNPKRMNVEVYAPCVEFAVVDMEEQECYGNEVVKMAARSQEQYEATCECFTLRMGQMVRETAVPNIAAMVERGYSMEDPIASLRWSSAYGRERQNILDDCVSTYSEQ